jgi:hypothetical protein
MTMSQLQHREAEEWINWAERHKRRAEDAAVALSWRARVFDEAISDAVAYLGQDGLPESDRQELQVLLRESRDEKARGARRAF